MYLASAYRVDAIDPALRRSGRFDAEVEVTVPNEQERFQILKVTYVFNLAVWWNSCLKFNCSFYLICFITDFQLYTKKIPLDPNVDLETIAASCNGYVGADLEALCREATMFAVKRSSDGEGNTSSFCLMIEDWTNARSIVGPSITRGVTVEIPKVTWEDIGGLNELKVCKLYIW